MVSPPQSQDAEETQEIIETQSSTASTLVFSPPLHPADIPPPRPPTNDLIDPNEVGPNGTFIYASARTRSMTTSGERLGPNGTPEPRRSARLLQRRADIHENAPDAPKEFKKMPSKGR